LKGIDILKAQTFEYAVEIIDNTGEFLRQMDVTNDYDEDRIRFVVNLWNNKEDKLSILDKIEQAYHYDKDYKVNRVAPTPFDDTDDLPF
jgi:hypothetical protein